MPPEVLLERIAKRLASLNEEYSQENYETIIDLAIAVKSIRKEIDEIRKITTYVDLLEVHLSTIQKLEWYKEAYKDHGKDVLNAIDHEIALRAKEIDKILLTHKNIPL